MSKALEMAPDSVESRLQHLQPIVLHSSSGQLRVLDRAARIVCDVESGGSDDHVVAQLEAVLAESPRSSWNPDVRLYIQLVEGALQLSCLPDALAKLCLFLEPSSYRQITVHSSEPIGDQELVVTALSKTRELLGDSRNVGIEVVGPLKVAPERFLDSLFDAGIRLRVAAGWAPGQEASQCLGVDAVALRAYAEYGFRVAIAWYVHAYNIEALKERIPELLLVNMNSGLSLPLACESPFYEFGHDSPPMPQAAEYCRLLMFAYKNYPYFDDVLAPLDRLALLIRGSGWHFDWNMPAEIGVSIDSLGRVGLYRQSPSLTIPWTNVDDLSGLSVPEIRGAFFDFTNRVWRWENNQYCVPCRWKYTCGGLDAFVESKASATDLDVICAHRKVFLEHFASLRGADRVIQ